MPIPVFITWRYVGPDLSGPAMKEALRKAIDTSLAAHWGSFGGRHFQKTAISRYGGPYAAARAAKRADSYKAKLAAKSPDELAEYFARKRVTKRINRFFGNMTPEQRAKFSRMSPEARRRLVEKIASGKTKSGDDGTNKSGADPRGDTPLVKSGRLRSASRVASKTFHLPISRRKMRIHSLPWYLTVNRPEQIDKVKALQMIASDENLRFGIRVGKRMAEKFKRNEVTRESK